MFRDNSGDYGTYNPSGIQDSSSLFRDPGFAIYVPRSGICHYFLFIFSVYFKIIGRGRKRWRAKTVHVLLTLSFTFFLSFLCGKDVQIGIDICCVSRFEPAYTACTSLSECTPRASYSNSRRADIVGMRFECTLRNIFMAFHNWQRY